ncbi:hypothetical protein J3R83DRAFT_12791 [Lanmaoa asiatica]|nr:hypothetical protein J3R83DRAFT_12791 [Lanmaoa asiatica]
MRLLSVLQSAAVDARLLNDQERNEKSGRQELAEAAPVKRTLTAKRTKTTAANRPQPGPAQPRDVDVQMADTTPTKSTLQEKKRSPQRATSPTPFHHGKVSPNLLRVPPPEHRTAPSSSNQAIGPQSVAEAPPHVRAVSSTNIDQEWKVRPAAVGWDATTNDIGDDPEDLYGPPVERRIIRILPSLADELREQQRRVAAEKEKRRAPLAPDWIFAKHVHDPSWKEIPTGGRKRVKRRKPTTTGKLGDNGLNVNELMGCFAVQNWVQEHKT